MGHRETNEHLSRAAGQEHKIQMDFDVGAAVHQIPPDISRSSEICSL